MYIHVRSYRLMVTTSPLHVENIGSNPIKIKINTIPIITNM